MARRRSIAAPARRPAGIEADRGPEQTNFRAALEVWQTQRKDYFESLDSYLEYIAQAPTCPWPKSRKIGEPEWFGTTSFDAALDLARHGWPEGTEYARQYSAELGAALDHVEVAEDWTRQVTGGGNIDIAAFNQGRPDCFLNYEPIDDQRRFVTIQYNARLSGDVNEQSCIRRGSMIAAVVDAMETQGYRTRVIWGFANAGANGYRLEVYVTVKNYSESLDLDKLVFLTANLAAHRRLNWSYKDLLPNVERQLLNVGESEHSGYGAGSTLTDAADLSFSGSNNYRNAAAAAAAVRDILKNYKVTI